MVKRYCATVEQVVRNEHILMWSLVVRYKAGERSTFSGLQSVLGNNFKHQRIRRTTSKLQASKRIDLQEKRNLLCVVTAKLQTKHI